MLILSRRKAESVMIGDGIEVKIIEIQGGIVRIGIRAPKETPIWREELWKSGKPSNTDEVDILHPAEKRERCDSDV